VISCTETEKHNTWIHGKTFKQRSAHRINEVTATKKLIKKQPVTPSCGCIL